MSGKKTYKKGLRISKHGHIMNTKECVQFVMSQKKYANKSPQEIVDLLNNYYGLTDATFVHFRVRTVRLHMTQDLEEKEVDVVEEKPPRTLKYIILSRWKQNVN